MEEGGRWEVEEGQKKGKKGRHHSKHGNTKICDSILPITNLGHAFHCLCHGSLGAHRLRTEDNTHTHRVHTMVQNTLAVKRMLPAV